ncbi:vesicular integral-membrane protein VIP36 precursor [Eremomyces bilateralis CBS 781.70]|uniref:Vesicular integral-membrane protein VIP36 n=1 Tax=Eremomyces bilateralis CBS 781.70 TaxID=1392243 RepID=A0A6G1FTT9_9PEZI|nr:vesicular integral-membrane protein VIP36 precursor [Eremomyces bilateralis CBS 781.70]KAF1809118.1 vesicular integral-membrane protein VIP36 precursor [Eremomyces bilateralis CBS 781.70]
MIFHTLISTALLLSFRTFGTRAADNNNIIPDDVRAIELRTHSLNAPYLDNEMQSRWFDFGADTVVRTDQYVRLTGELPSRSGWLWSRVPLTATNWQIVVEFKIHGTGTLYGDGMAMWLTKQRAQQGAVFGSMDKFDGLGIFFDTYKNNRPGTVFPYVMAMMGDGQTSYDKHNDGKANELAGCSVRGIRNQNIPTKLRLTYLQDKHLVLDLQYKDEYEWTSCFTIPDVKIPGVAYLGFSAETGELADNHDIISISTKNLYSPGPGDDAHSAPKGSTKPSLKANREKRGSWFGLFFKFLLFGCVVAGCYVGFTMYRTSRASSRF